MAVVLECEALGMELALEVADGADDEDFASVVGDVWGAVEEGVTMDCVATA